MSGYALQTPVRRILATYVRAQDIFSATMRITLGTVMVLGVFLLVLLGLLSLMRELFAEEHAQAPAFADDDSRDSLAPQVSLQPERR